MTTIYDAVRAGEPMTSTPFIDTHGHFGPWSLTAIPYAMDYQRVIGEMDRFGCDMVWMSAADPGYGDAMRVKNDYVFDFAAQYPDRIIPYCTLSANEPDACLPELLRCLGRGRCVGVKMHIYHQTPYTLRDDFLQPVFEVLNEHRLLYLNHYLGKEEHIPWAAEQYPEVTFVNGHPWHIVNDLAQRYPNLRNCTCAAMSPDWMAREVRRVGTSTTMLLGSDFALFCLAFGVGMLAYAHLPEADKQNILGRNAVRLLQRLPWFDRALLRCTEHPE